MQTITYAIGDIHGRLDLLDQLLTLVETDAATRFSRAKVVFTGDYVDRGADSFGVVERLKAGPRRRSDQFVCLRGNHDELFCKAVVSGDLLPNWAWHLHWHTIKSYGTDRATSKDVAALGEHASFLAGLPLCHDDGTYFFVHAGIRPGVALDRQTDEDLMWIRDDFLSHTRPLPRRIVHGHTIVGETPVTTSNRISIDTGAYKSGILTAAVLDGSTVSFIQAKGDPDRGAIVREAILVATIAGRVITPEMTRAYDAFMAGDIDLADMEAKTRQAAA